MSLLMRAWPRLAAILFAAVALTACDDQSFLQAFAHFFVPKDAADASMHYAELLRTGHLSEIDAIIDPEHRESVDVIERLADTFPQETPKAVLLDKANWFSRSSSDVTTYRITYEYEFSHSQVYVTVTLRKSTSGEFQLEGFFLHR